MGDTRVLGCRTPPPLLRRQDERQDLHKASESGAETEVEEDEGDK